MVIDALAWDRSRLWHFRGRLLSVTDGDTAVVMLDLGCYARYEARIRLSGYSAPETWKPGGRDATARLAAALGSGVGEWPLRIITRQRDTLISEVRSFERYVADVMIVRDGMLVNVVELLGSPVI